MTDIIYVSLNNKKLEINEIFAFKEKRLLNSNEIDGEYILYDQVPKIYDKMLKSGIEPLNDMFSHKSKENKIKKKK